MLEAVNMTASGYERSLRLPPSATSGVEVVERALGGFHGGVVRGQALESAEPGD